jgi:AbrB family looped-hinge helix DNA binding protein
MNAVLTDDGKIMLPTELRENAHLKPGDTLELQLYKGTILLRKHQPLTPEQCTALLERSRSQFAPKPEDDDAVERAIREARAQRR